MSGIVVFIWKKNEKKRKKLELIDKNCKFVRIEGDLFLIGRKPIKEFSECPTSQLGVFNRRQK